MSKGGFTLCIIALAMLGCAAHYNVRTSSVSHASRVNYFSFLHDTGPNIATMAYTNMGYLNLSPEKPIILIEDKQIQARAWAVCAAYFEVDAYFLERDGQNLEARRLLQMSNDAVRAAAMTLLLVESEDLFSVFVMEEVDSAFRISDSMREDFRIHILADIDGIETGVEALMGVIGAVSHCKNNSRGMRFYLEAARKLVLPH